MKYAAYLDEDKDPNLKSRQLNTGASNQYELVEERLGVYEGADLRSLPRKSRQTLDYLLITKQQQEANKKVKKPKKSNDDSEESSDDEPQNFEILYPEQSEDNGQF